jgi:glyoxylase-like metal-dependent hydrolase (beta-lactamase superfamily II)
MTRAALHAWQSLSEDGSVRYLKYRFGPGTANTLAVRRDDDTWLVVSPAMDAPPSALDELGADGAVSALLAPNAYHHLGQEAWRQRFPDAVSYAAEGALPRLAKKSRTIPYRPLAELSRRLGARVGLFVPDGMKSPDALVRVSVPGVTVWWLGDLFSNSSAEDQIWLLRVIAPWFGSGLGYRRNTKPGVVYVRDAPAWLKSIRDSLAADPPSIVVPAHGDPVCHDTAARTQRLMTDVS